MASMNTGLKFRFDVEALKTRFGGTVFSRGEAYHRDGRVRVLSVMPARVLAEVEGTEDYRVEVAGRGAEIGGECSCLAFEDRGMCKHMVATALAANAAGDDDGEARGPLARIRDHLKAKSVEELVDMIVGLAEADPALFRRLDLVATAQSEDDETLKARFEAAIDRATRTGGYVDYEGARDWANRVDDALDALAELSSGPRASLVLELAEHAIDRIEEASMTSTIRAATAATSSAVRSPFTATPPERRGRSRRNWLTPCSSARRQAIAMRSPGP